MQEIRTDDAPAPLGPYSQGLVDGDRVFASGQGPADPETREIVSDDVADQTAQTMRNLGAILEAGGASLDDVVKTTVFLTDMDDYDAVNEVYEEFLSEPYPARSCVQVVRLPAPIKVEIEAVASLGD